MHTMFSNMSLKSKYIQDICPKNIYLIVNSVLIQKSYWFKSIVSFQ